MTFQTETVLSCSVPPSSRGFERLNTERDRGIGGAGGGPTGRHAGMAGDRLLESARGRQAVAVRLLPMPRRAAGERGDREHGPAADQPAAGGDEHFWEEANAEAVIQLQAAVLSGRWDQVLDRTRAATARDRRTDWRWEPLACLAELKALDDQDEGSPRPSTKKHSKRTAA